MEHIIYDELQNMIDLMNKISEKINKPNVTNLDNTLRNISIKPDINKINKMIEICNKSLDKLEHIEKNTTYSNDYITINPPKSHIKLSEHTIRDKYDLYITELQKNNNTPRIFSRLNNKNKLDLNTEYTPELSSEIKTTKQINDTLLYKYNSMKCDVELENDKNTEFRINSILNKYKILAKNKRENVTIDRDIESNIAVGDNVNIEFELDSEINKTSIEENIDIDLDHKTPNISDKSETLNNIKQKKRRIIDNYGYEEYMFYMELEECKRRKLELIENQIKSLNKTDIPIRFKILAYKIPIKNKAIIIHKLDDLLSCRVGINTELAKYINWINSLLKLPFGKYINFDITIDTESNIISNFLINSKEILDAAIYGHTETKEYILEIIAHWIRNPNSENNMIALHGSAGTGKTCIIKDGLAKVLKRPFIFISLGGVSNVSFFNGHSFTYEGSTFGKIAEALIQSECMNPIIYFDELDKVSDTPHGEEIINLLIHLTDSSQNSNFNDKYFSSIPIDLSKCLFIFSFNHLSKINPILLDRLSVINVKDYNLTEKCTIGKKHLLPNILKDFNLSNNEIEITEDNIKYIISNHIHNSGGVRPLKKCLYKIISKINYLLFMQDFTLFKINEKIKLTNNIIDELIKNNNNDFNEINPSLQHMFI
jgi:ATP-dependent Lon protease